MCRTGGRRCPSHSNPAAITARNARRRAQYHQKKNNPTTPEQTTQTPNTFSSSPTSTLTPQQTAYFENSKATENGELVRLYHGASTEFNSFNPELLGRGNDSWGNGFYFTNEKTVAQGYANESNSPTANVKEFYLNLTNPMHVDGKANMSLNDITFTADQAARILKNHPLAYTQPENDDDDMSFLGDYSERYWDKTQHTTQELNSMIDEVAQQHFSDTSWTELESLYGRDYGAAFLQAIHSETGHDGVIVDFGPDESKHYIAWFPNQMKLTSNITPEDNHQF